MRDLPGFGVRYGDGLRRAVGASAGPYGYTLTIWTSGAVVIHARGVPDGLEAILFMLGNVAAFAAIGGIAFRCPPGRGAEVVSHPVLWASFHFVPAVLGVGVITALVGLVPGTLAWPGAGLTATASYLLCVAAQIALLADQRFESVGGSVAVQPVGGQREVKDGDGRRGAQ